MWTQAILNALLLCMSNQTILYGLHHTIHGLMLHTILFPKDNELHLRLLAVASVVVFVGGSLALNGMFYVIYVRLWLATVFNMSAWFGLVGFVVPIVIIALVASPIVFYLTRFPPQNWMSSRIARLSH